MKLKIFCLALSHHITRREIGSLFSNLEQYEEGHFWECMERRERLFCKKKTAMQCDNFNHVHKHKLLCFNSLLPS